MKASSKEECDAEKEDWSRKMEMFMKVHMR